MPKDIFSKIIKDYNNELEIILEQKAFSSDVKNLLLSMLYKIENAYEDYKKVKVNVCEKKQFVEEILETIKEKCDEIEIIKPMSEEGQELYENSINCIVDKENKKIKTFQNEKSILDAILQMRQQDIELNEKYELIEKPIKELLKIGNNMNSLEVIRDFNGWSWDIATIEMKNIIYNKVYQLLIILIGSKIIDTWVNNRKSEEIEEIPSNVILSSKYNENYGITIKEMQEQKDYVEEIVSRFSKLYGKEKTKEFFKKIIQIIILENSKNDKEYKERIIKEIAKINQELEKMKNNKTFIEELSLQKKKINKQIKDIDTILNDEKTLKEQYENTNKKLPNKEKIFSVSHFKLMYEKQREKLLKKIKNINTKMEPQQFIEIKKSLQEKLEFYEHIQIEEISNENTVRLLKQLEEIFLECILEKIEKTNEKNGLEKIIYELRYYKLIPPIVTKETDEIERKLIKKACEQKILTKFSEKEEINHQILKHIFTSKIIDLSETVYTLKYTKGTLTLNIYDGNTHDETKQIQITEKTELNVKLNKKIKIFPN